MGILAQRWNGESMPKTRGSFVFRTLNTYSMWRWIADQKIEAQNHKIFKFGFAIDVDVCVSASCLSLKLPSSVLLFSHHGLLISIQTNSFTSSVISSFLVRACCGAYENQTFDLAVKMNLDHPGCLPICRFFQILCFCHMLPTWISSEGRLPWCLKRF